MTCFFGRGLEERVKAACDVVLHKKTNRMIQYRITLKCIMYIGCTEGEKREKCNLFDYCRLIMKLLVFLKLLYWEASIIASYIIILFYTLLPSLELRDANGKSQLVKPTTHILQ
jgi:hypothetical protein